LLGAAIDRQHVDQIENKDNDEKRDQRADKHFEFPLGIADGDGPLAVLQTPTPARAAGSSDGTHNRWPSAS
jgi:hypothetical protein